MTAPRAIAARSAGTSPSPTHRSTAKRVLPPEKRIASAASIAATSSGVGVSELSATSRLTTWMSS